MFSESDLAFLAFVFIVTLGCLMLGRRRIPPVKIPRKKKRKKIKMQPLHFDDQYHLRDFADVI